MKKAVCQNEARRRFGYSDSCKTGAKVVRIGPRVESEMLGRTMGGGQNLMGRCPETHPIPRQKQFFQDAKQMTQIERGWTENGRRARIRDSDGLIWVSGLLLWAKNFDPIFMMGYLET